MRLASMARTAAQMSIIPRFCSTELTGAPLTVVAGYVKDETRSARLPKKNGYRVIVSTLA